MKIISVLVDKVPDCPLVEVEEENDHLQDCWFRDETICPDGSLRPKVSDLLNRIAKLEAYVAELEAEKRGEK